LTDPKTAILAYQSDLLTGIIPSSRWIFAAAQRFERDLAREDIYMDWESLGRLADHFRRLSLIGDASGESFELHPWQLWCLANIWGWRRSEDHLRRVQLAILQVARGNGKTTLAAGLALWDLEQADGRRVHVIANTEEQAGICLETARTMIRRKADSGYQALWDRIVDKGRDCEFTALAALERSLDGLNPSMWIADEAAEFKGRFLTKLLTTGAKRKESLGLIITTPGANPENIYGELVAQGEAILKQEVEDDTIMPLLFGLDPSDKSDDETVWPKANPGMPHGQPDARSIRRSWNRMKVSPMGRAEFDRYHCARWNENTGGWLDMGLWPTDQPVDWAALRGRPAWIGMDLSKSLDMTVVSVCVPLDDGRIAIRGHYWWPSADIRQRELDYRLPVRAWAADGRITLTPGREIDYEAVRTRIGELMEEFDVRSIGYDAWGSRYLVEQLVKDGAPMVAYRMGIGTFGPGCQLWQNLWAGRKFVFGDDPILRRACATAIAQRDRNGNIRPIKPNDKSTIDALVASIIAVHVWGGTQGSSYD
jgi:phage terminase large subunit-like protein